jgi:hypothetical protein
MPKPRIIASLPKVYVPAHKRGVGSMRMMLRAVLAAVGVSSVAAADGCNDKGVIEMRRSRLP